MGQQQSSNSQSITTRTSYYDVLGVSKISNDDEIKRAYRKKALELHPDRNYGNVDEATRAFAEIQTAYEVLSNPQERAWYDSHEASFLSGTKDGDQSFPVTTSEDIAELYANFGGDFDFSDSPGGFYTSLKSMFEKIAYEEKVASEDQNIEPISYPALGFPEGIHHEGVKLFYDVWSNFSTRKSFAWKDIYRLSEAPDRRVRRAMEKENRRLREDATKDFNDTVRTLVAFVKRRDPRCKINKLTDAQRQKVLRDQTTAQAVKARAANQARLEEHSVPDWTFTHRSDDELSDTLWSEGHDDQEGQHDQEEHFECIVCRKTFKAEKQYEAHARSKKHIQAVKKLQWQMRKEGLKFGLDARQDLGEISCPDAPIEDSKTDTFSITVQMRNFDADYDDPTSNMQLHRESPLSGNEGSEDPGGENNTLQDDIPNKTTSMRDQTILSEEDNLKATRGKIKTGKAKQKRAKRRTKEKPDETRSMRCAVCKQEFLSRNQLFAHLRENPSHAQPLQKPGRGAKGNETESND